MVQIMLTKIEALLKASICIASTQSKNSMVYNEEIIPNLSSILCSSDLFKSYTAKYLSLSFTVLVDLKGNEFLTLKELVRLSGRKRDVVWKYFDSRNGMIKVGYRPKGTGGRPMTVSKSGVAHVNQNLIPLVGAMEYIRTRPENKKGVRKYVG